MRGGKKELLQTGKALNNVDGHLDLKCIRTMSTGEQHLREETDTESQRARGDRKKYKTCPHPNPIKLPLRTEGNQVSYMSNETLFNFMLLSTDKVTRYNDYVNIHNLCSSKTQT